MPERNLARSVDTNCASEHDELLRMLRHLRQVVRARNATRRELMLHVEALVSVIEMHFQHEEEEDGFFAEVLAEAPQLQNKVNLLQQQHYAFRTILAELHKKSLDYRSSPVWWREMQHLFEEFASQFQVHENLEDALIQEAFDRDLGDAGDF